MRFPFKHQVSGAALVSLAIVRLQVATALGQGSLTPPGSPAPAMKSLAEIEPRTPIKSVPFLIAQPGSYYLATNLTVASGDAITINANNVGLDLNGFTISSTESPAGTSFAIRLGGNSENAVTNITIINGFISSGVVEQNGTYSGNGFGYGIAYPGVIRPYNARVSGVSVCGCRFNGIHLGLFNSSAVNSCSVNTVGGLGISAQSISDSTAVDCGNSAINASMAHNCYGTSFAGSGISANAADNCVGNAFQSGNGVDASLALNCYGSSSVGTGVYASQTVESSYGSAFSGGAGVYSAGTALNSSGFSTIGIGLYAEHCAQNCYGLSEGSAAGLVTSLAQNCFGQSQSGTGLTFTKLGAMCYGVRASPGAVNYVIGTGLAGPVNLP